MKILSALSLIVMLAAGCGDRPIVLGNPPPEQAQDPISRLMPSPNPVEVRGEVIEKGKRWIVVSDGTGQVRVETETLKADVDEIPLHGKVWVAGIYNPKKEIEATGIRTE
jgi:hypothetical protein